MKPASKWTMVVLLIFSTYPFSNLFAQANCNLSNLCSPTAVNQHLIPSGNNNRNLGSANKSWKDLYLDGSIYLNDVKFITNKPGSGCTFIGNTGNTINSGLNNTFVGFNSGFSNTTGNNNTANGQASLLNNSTGENNTAIGMSSLLQNTTGSQNTALGQSALYANATGSYNTAIGYNTMRFGGFTSGNMNTALGSNALGGNQGDNNTATGAGALSSNTTGDDNTASGLEALRSNSIGNSNTATGKNALWHASASENTADGFESSFLNSSGNQNTGIGFQSLYSNVAGSNNTSIGAGAGTQTDSLSNTTALGSFARTLASNQIRLGNPDVTSIGGYADWTNVSDERVKKNIKHNVPGLEFINKLIPVTYNLNLDAADMITQNTHTENAQVRSPANPDAERARSDKEKIIYTGFIAQDVEKAAKELNFDFSGVDPAKNSHDLYGLRYAEFVVPLVKAVQELSARNDEKDLRMQAMQDQIDELRQTILQMQNSGSTGSGNKTLIELSSARLDQNTPNPFNQKTTINYYLPQSANNSMIEIASVSGQIIKTVTLSQKGNGELIIAAGELAAGSYQYALIVDGKLIDKKTMILTK